VAERDRFDHNSKAGLWVADGQLEVSTSSVIENLTGIRVAGFSRRFEAADDTIADNVKDGVALDVRPGIVITGNSIDSNGGSAISTNAPFELKKVLATNRLFHNGIATRIRASD
jgi:hypothetical protein